MKKLLKWLGIVLGSLLALIVIVFFALAMKGNAIITHTFDVSAENVPIPTDVESVGRGEHWVKAECIGCHGDDLSGGAFFEAPFGYVDAKNLTPGKGGAGTEFNDQDWVRAIRHGVNPEDHSLLIMPASNFWYYSDEDLGDILAYVKSLPPVDNETREPDINLLGKAMLGAGILGRGVVVAQEIQHDARPDFPPAGVTMEYGTYLVNVSGCRDCHGPDLSGGKSADPTSQNAPNLTPGGELIAWQEPDFIKAIRTGVAPSGHQLDPVQMPWEHFKNFSDDELRAIFTYLQTLQRLETTVP
ncbi:MAG: cytochrome c [Anaerolineales bacterium]|nr:cytochrome c [Anaerolineales bacterium]